MRVVDCFTDVLLFTRKFCRGEISGMSVDQVSGELQNLFEQSRLGSEKEGMANEHYLAAKYPIVALIDEMLQTSSWQDKSEWSKNPLQRIYFNTTNAGSEFYNRLNVLNKQRRFLYWLF